MASGRTVTDSGSWSLPPRSAANAVLRPAELQRDPRPEHEHVEELIRYRPTCGGSGLRPSPRDVTERNAVEILLFHSLASPIVASGRATIPIASRQNSNDMPSADAALWVPTLDQRTPHRPAARQEDADLQPRLTECVGVQVVDRVRDGRQRAPPAVLGEPLTRSTENASANSEITALCRTR